MLVRTAGLEPAPYLLPLSELPVVCLSSWLRQLISAAPEAKGACVASGNGGLFNTPIVPPNVRLSRMARLPAFGDGRNRTVMHGFYPPLHQISYNPRILADSHGPASFPLPTLSITYTHHILCVVMREAEAHTSSHVFIYRVRMCGFSSCGQGICTLHGWF